MNDRRRDRVLRALAVRCARELGKRVDDVLAELNEAVNAGLLEVTRTGVRAALPEQETHQ